MNSETDTNSTTSRSSGKERQLLKSHKKLKKKLEKKHKKDKKKNTHKKSSRKELKKTHIEGDYSKTPEPQGLITNSNVSYTEENNAFGPALPPHLLNKNEEFNRNEALVIGPIIPTNLLGNLEDSKSEKLGASIEPSKLENEDECFYGPLPVTSELEMTSVQIELEQRALKLKMSAMDGTNATTNNQNVREEWMLELPEVGLKGGLAALNNLKRGFYQGKEKPDFNDRSSWTKTPNLGQEKPKHTSSKEGLELQAKALYEKERDAEQETIATKYKKKHKRDMSLVQMHQKKLRKGEKKKLKELKDSGLKPERRPFTRDIDLKLNKIDRNQTKQIVDKAKILNTKFSSGHSKYL